MEVIDISIIKPWLIAIGWGIVGLCGIFGWILRILSKGRSTLDEHIKDTKKDIEKKAAENKDMIKEMSTQTTNAIIQLQSAVQDNNIKLTEALEGVIYLEKRVNRIEDWKESVNEQLIRKIK